MKPPKSHSVLSQGQHLNVFEWPGTGPTVLLVHATGFHARCWDQVVAHLGDARVIAPDMMGHGRSDRQEIPLDWQNYGQNVIDVVKGLGLTHIVAGGHSLGGESVVRAAATLPDLFAGLVLIDPVIYAPGANSQFSMDWQDFPVARRRNEFKAVAEMIERLATKGSYAKWDPRVLLDYCTYGLLPKKDGSGFELACPPKIESSTYVAKRSGDIYGMVRSIDIPVDVVRAQSPSSEEQMWNFETSPTYPGLASEFPKGRDIHLETMTHFIPMQDPALTAKLILDMVQRVEPARAPPGRRS